MKEEQEIGRAVPRSSPLNSQAGTGKGELAAFIADWLVTEVGECSLAVPVPPREPADPWGQPDVVGLRPGSLGEGGRSESVAVKIAPSCADLSSALGQAGSFKLCCNRVYLVIRHDFGPAVVERCTAVCSAFGIGVIAFRELENVPVVGLRARAVSEEPDPFFPNEWLDWLELLQSTVFDQTQRFAPGRQTRHSVASMFGQEGEEPSRRG
jgi:hypothetical protein